jgi:hypothetical protein
MLNVAVKTLWALTAVLSVAYVSHLRSRLKRDWIPTDCVYVLQVYSRTNSIPPATPRSRRLARPERRPRPHPRQLAPASVSTTGSCFGP